LPSRKSRREPIWLNRELVELLHERQLAEHGGQAGLRDEGLLESALARAINTFGHDENADLATLAADYGYGLARNHAFVDGNKRIAFVAVNVFLILNGFEVEADEVEVVDVMTRLAAGRLARAGFADWLREHM
jgi:death on curing protein